jgi:hypothetical protein
MPDYVPDNYDAWEEHQREQDERLENLPKCSECREPIQEDECYDFDGDLICEDCLKKNHKVWTENYIREDEEDV